MCSIDTKEISVCKHGGNASEAFHMQVSEEVLGMKALLPLSCGGILDTMSCDFPERLHGLKLLTESF